MNNSTSSVCTRCGKQRVVIGTHDEVVGNSTVTYTDTACPDKSCQTAVEDKLVKEKEKREIMSNTSKFGANPRNSKRSDSL